LPLSDPSDPSDPSDFSYDNKHEFDYDCEHKHDIRHKRIPTMDTLLAGVAVRDITPAPGVRQWGYSARKTPATGALDPLHAKVLVFDAGQRVALVALDLGRVPAEAVLNDLRARAAVQGIDGVLFCATHTHHGPVMEDTEAPHMAPLAEAVEAALAEAAASLRPVRFGYGRATVDIGHNRRRIVDGRCHMVWRNETKEPSGPVDREAFLIRLDAEDGAPLASIVHFACHPVVMGPENLLYSADYVGELTRLVAEATGAPCLFLQGACGDINPYRDKTGPEEDAVAAMREVGRSAAEAILPAMAAISTAPPATPSVAFLQRPIPVGTRWDFNDAEALRTFQSFHIGLFDRYVEDLDPDLEVPLTVCVLNRELALVGIPGEPPIQFQLDLKATSPVKHGLVCGYTNGYHAYFPSVRDALAGGYGGTLASYVGLGAGERLLTEAKVDIARLLGKDHRRCTVEDFAGPA
jgi:neutral ceramidase